MDLPTRSYVPGLKDKRAEPIVLYCNNSGAFVDSNKHFYRFGVVGSPDIVCVVNGQYVGIEVKAPKGRESENQKEFQVQLEAAGGGTYWLFSLGDVIAAI